MSRSLEIQGNWLLGWEKSKRVDWLVELREIGNHVELGAD